MGVDDGTPARIVTVTVFRWARWPCAGASLSHVLLQEGHLWGRKEVAIPIGAVASTGDGIQLTIAKQEVQDLPPVDIDHPDRRTDS